MGQILLLLCVFAALVFLNTVLLRFYAVRETAGAGDKWRGLTARWDLSPQSLGGFTYWKLALVSALTLFLELLE